MGDFADVVCRLVDGRASEILELQRNSPQFKSAVYGHDWLAAIFDAVCARPSFGIVCILFCVQLIGLCGLVAPKVEMLSGEIN